MYEIRARGETGDKHNDDRHKTEYSAENRLYIYKYILNYPGVHLRKICRAWIGNGRYSIPAVYIRKGRQNKI